MVHAEGHFTASRATACLKGPRPNGGARRGSTTRCASCMRMTMGTYPYPEAWCVHQSSPLRVRRGGCVSSLAQPVPLRPVQRGCAALHRLHHCVFPYPPPMIWVVHQAGAYDWQMHCYFRDGWFRVHESVLLCVLCCVFCVRQAIGACAGLIQCIATNPMEITKIRLQASSAPVQFSVQTSACSRLYSAVQLHRRY